MAEEVIVEKLTELAIEKGLGVAGRASMIAQLTGLADTGELTKAFEAAEKFAGGGLLEGVFSEGAASWVALGTGLSPMAVYLFLGKVLGIGSFPDEAIGPCPSHTCPVDSAKAGMSGGDFPCVQKWGHPDEHRCGNGHVWADKWNTAWTKGWNSPE